MKKTKQKLKRQQHRLLMLFACLFALTQAMWADTYGENRIIVLQTDGNWAASTPKFKAQFWGADFESSDIDFMSLPNQTNKYYILVPAGNTENMHLKRYSTDGNTLWNAIYDIPASSLSGKNMVTVSSNFNGSSKNNDGYTAGTFSFSSNYTNFTQKVLYFKPNSGFNQDADGETFTLQILASDGNFYSIEGEYVEGVTGSKVFKFSIPSNITPSIVRVMRGTWNYTQHMTYSAGNNCITMPNNVDDWQNASCSWTSYTEPITNYDHYALYNQGNNWYDELTWSDEDNAYIGTIYPPNQDGNRWNSFRIKIGKGANYNDSKIFGYGEWTYNVNNDDEYNVNQYLTETVTNNNYFNTSGCTSPYKVLLYVDSEGMPNRLLLQKMDFYITYKQTDKDLPFEEFKMTESSDGTYSFNYNYAYAAEGDISAGSNANLYFRFFAKKGSSIINFGSSASEGQNEYHDFLNAPGASNKFENINLVVGSTRNFQVNGNDAGLKGIVSFNISKDKKASVSISDAVYTWYFIRKYNVDQFIDFTWNARGGYYEAMMPSVWQNNEFHVIAAMDRNWTGNLWYGWGTENWKVNDNTGSHIIDMQQNRNALTFESGNDYEVRLFVADGQGSLPVRLEFVPIASNGMPFYPEGITSDAQLASQGDTPYYYLIGHGLNNDIASPEWEMMDNGDGTYSIDFTFTDHTAGDGCNITCKDNEDVRSIKVAKYTANQTNADYQVVYTDVKPVEDEKIQFKTDFDQYYGMGGVRLRATYDPSGNGSLKYEYLKQDGTTTDNYEEAQYLPMISLIGKNWLQGEGVPINIEVPKANKKYDNNWDNTSLGWQQAWIQYNKSGNAVTSRDKRKVYFNTQWPPVNPIQFHTSYVDDEGVLHEMELSSDNLAFTPVGTPQSATEWKKTYPMVDFECAETDKDGEDKSLYALYKVSDMWITGDFKLWSGWNGCRNSNEGSGADWYWNWGHESETPWPDTWPLQGDQGELKDGAGTVHLGTKNGDMSFAKPSHFSNVYFFLDVKHPNTGTEGTNKHNLLYFEKGAISILAEGVDYQYGTFKPTLEDIDEGAKVTSIKISVYVNNEDKDLLGVIMDKKVPAETLINDDAKFKAFIAPYFYNTVQNQHTGFLWDGITDYDDGSYIYKLEVTVANQEAVGGEEYLVTESNPFRIYSNSFDHELKGAQLIKLPEDTEGLSYKDIIAGYTHMTYNASYENKLVKIVNGVVVKIANRPATLSTNAIKEIYEKTGVWTNTVILGAQVPSFDELEAASAEFTSFEIYDTAEGSTINGNLLYNVTESPEWYAYLVPRSTNMGTKTFRTKIHAMVAIDEGDEPKDIWELPTIKTGYGSYSYAPHFMLPAMGEPMFSFENNETREYTVSHDDLYNEIDEDLDAVQQTIETDRHEIRAFVPVAMPNVENEIKNAVYNALNFSFVYEGKEFPVKVNENKTSNHGNKKLVNGELVDAKPADYYIEYNYQNPYDWMECSVDLPMEDELWSPIPHKWGIAEQAYDKTRTAITGILPTTLPTEVELESNPVFNKPSIVKIKANNSNEDVYDVTYALDWTLEDDVYTVEMQIAHVNLGEGDIDDFLENIDDFSGRSEFSRTNGTYILKVDVDGDDNNIEPISVVVTKKELSSLFNNEGNPSRTPIATFKIPAAGLNDGADFYNEINKKFTDLKIYLSRAYMFSAVSGINTNEENKFEDVASSNTESQYVGLEAIDGSFPAIRYDHQPPTQGNKPRRAAGNNNNSDSLNTGDNAFMIAPYYVELKTEQVTLDAVPTGIDNFGYDMDGVAQIIVGKGFIDMNGNEGVIYSADGRLVYSGGSRAELAQGVYVVSLGRKAVKVLVK